MRHRPKPPAAITAVTSLASATAALTAAQRDHLAQRLLQERAYVLRALGRRLTPDVDHAGTPNRVPDHMADIGSEAMAEALEATLASRETFTLGEIDEALRRLYRHPERFGLDEVTGEPIAFARLDIIPWARRTVAA